MKPSLNPKAFLNNGCIARAMGLTVSLISAFVAGLGWGLVPEAPALGLLVGLTSTFVAVVTMLAVVRPVVEEGL